MSSSNANELKILIRSRHQLLSNLMPVTETESIVILFENGRGGRLHSK